jgi:hypothetical protein
VLNYLESESITIIKHPPNSPDLAPCDFWWFDFIKENLPDQSDSESLHCAASDFMNSLNKEEYRKHSINGFNECDWVWISTAITSNIWWNKNLVNFIFFFVLRSLNFAYPNMYGRLGTKEDEKKEKKMRRTKRMTRR